MFGTASKKLGVAIVGTGFGQKVHLPGFQHHPRTEVVAIYHRDPAKAEAIAQAHAIPHAFSELSDLLACEDVQGVSIATPPFLHYEMAKQVIEAGKHLLLEKPLTLSASETRELYHLARQNHVIALADFEFRFVPAWQLLAEYLQQDYVGNKRLIKIDWIVGSRANPEREWNWYAQRAQGGGALGAVASHSFDYIHWLFGPVKRLCAHLTCAIAQRPDPLADNQLKPVDAEDTGLILLELTDGTPCQLCFSAVTYHGRGHWLEIYGDRGSLILGSDNLKDYVHGFSLKGGTAGKPLLELEIPKRLAFPQVFADGRIAPFIRVVDRWLASIDAGESLTPSLREGVYSQLLMDLTHHSNDNHSWVDVPDLAAFVSD